jgi:polysaccharide export outer membrane protein
VRTWEEKDTFKLAVDHTVTVKFVHVPELNEEQRVRPDGNISLPYLGNVYVVGRTLDELIQELKKRYSSILQNPDLYVIVPEFRSRIKELKADLHTAPRGLSRLVTVRPDGYVTFPMLGDVFVAKKTLPDINKELNTMYDRILPGLHVDLFLEKHAGSKIYILGQVKSPGAYDISKPMTLAEILAISGSFLPGAKLDSVIVMRRHEGKVVATKIDFRNTLTAKGGYTLFFLKPDDIVYVPKKVITEAGELMRDLADVLLFRGWSVGFSWELHKEPDITIKQ